MTRHQHAQLNRGFFAVGIFGSKTPENLGTLWRSATLYRAAFVFTVGKRYSQHCTDTTKFPRHNPLFHFTDVDDLVSHLPLSTPLVGVEMTDAAVPLGRFAHPLRACYLLGAEDHGLPPKVLDHCHKVVSIESPEPYSMNVAVAGSMVLRDRYLQATSLAATA